MAFCKVRLLNEERIYFCRFFFLFTEWFFRCGDDYLGKIVVLSGGDERFIGEKGAIIGARSYVTGEYVAFTGGNKHISGERVTNIKTRTVKSTILHIKKGSQKYIYFYRPPLALLNPYPLVPVLVSYSAMLRSHLFHLPLMHRLHSQTAKFLYGALGVRLLNSQV